MISITKVVEWDMGHRVPNHKSKCRNPHGHRYRLELTIAGEVDTTAGASSEGMVVDFGDVKSVMMTRVHDVLDHGFMYYEHDPVMSGFFATCGESFQAIPVDFIPTAENLARWCGEQLHEAFGPGVIIENVRVFETPNSWADYRP
ncbi:MAG: 6-pyruvoyltetrahydropterin/6-carboxytetrahydropterin synthase [Rhodothermales bacterium]|jgi:6-pyruvoyltetrahydropterin/6-carboxytetrahydropterin synthase